MRWSPPSISDVPRGVIPNRWDLLAVPLILGILFLFAAGARQMTQPLSAPHAIALSLDPAYLPIYALRTTLRMLVAMGFSLLFTFTYATAAAKSRRAELVLIPVLDVLQSVPVLGYVSFAVTFFLRCFPAACWGRNSPPSSPSSPARPGTWPSVSISRCAPYRRTCTR